MGNKGILIRALDTEYEFPDFNHTDLPSLYELIRKEKFIMIEKTIIRVDNIKDIYTYEKDSIS